MTGNGLTPEEWAAWCKSKKDYKPLIRKKNRTEDETLDMRRMAIEYRDTHRRADIDRGHLKFTPKTHTSLIFSDLPGYTGGD